MTNTAIWDALAKTDPAHTKSFSRAGGFKGTAIKPIYCDQKMTQQFGPCGKGWGMTEPCFQVVNTAEQILVYCTVGLWWEQPGQLVYGVGGDVVQGKNKYGTFVDDEAFKKAYTDAIGNAMKHLGMSADVHMGMFDDNKYVKELQEEFADNGGARKNDPPPSSGSTSKTGGAPSPHIPVPLAGTEPDWKTWAQVLVPEAIKAATDDAQIDAIVKANGPALDNLKAVSPKAHDSLMKMAKFYIAHFVGKAA